MFSKTICPKCADISTTTTKEGRICNYCRDTNIIVPEYDDDDFLADEPKYTQLIFDEYVKDNPLYDPEMHKQREITYAENAKRVEEQRNGFSTPSAHQSKNKTLSTIGYIIELGSIIIGFIVGGVSGNFVAGLITWMIVGFIAIPLVLLDPNPPIKENRSVPTNNSVLKCPKCGSTAVTTGARGYSIITGFLGAGSTVNRCGNCGHKWKPKG